MYEYMIDSFLAKGIKLNDFRHIAKQFDENTELIKLNFNNSVPMHLVNESGDKYCLKVLRPCSIFKISNTGVYALAEDAVIKKARLEKMNKDFAEEFTNKNRTLMLFDKKGHFFTSELMAKTFGGKFTSIGGKFLRQSSLERDICFAKLTEQEEMPSGVALVRKADGIPKIFAVYTERYKRTPLSLLSDVVTRMEAEEGIKFWTVSQKKAEIYFDLDIPELKNKYLIPGILLETSDTGYAQTVVNLCWRDKKSSVSDYFIQDSVSFKHSTDVTVEELIETIQNFLNEQKSFLQKYEVYHEALELKKIQNEKEYKKYVTSVMTDLNFKKILGMAGEKKLFAWFVEQYNENVKNAAYVFDKIIGLDRANLRFSESQNNEFRYILQKCIAA